MPRISDEGPEDTATPTPAEYSRFVVLSAARTGSNLLASLLNASPEITCFRELFNQPAGFIDYGVEGYDPHDESDRAQRDTDFPSFLQQRIFCEHPSGVRAVGYKMPYEHFIWFPTMEDWIAEHRDMRILHLRRRNLLRSLVSLRVAEMTGGWVEEQPFSLAGAMKLRYAVKAVRHPLRAATALQRLLLPRFRPPEQPAWKAKQEPVTLSPEECRFYFEWAPATAENFNRRFEQHALLTIFYEDLVDRQRATLNDVQAFLGLEPRWLTPTTRKQNPEPLSELVGNYDELVEAFRDTEYRAFFD